MRMESLLEIEKKYARNISRILCNQLFSIIHNHKSLMYRKDVMVLIVYSMTRLYGNEQTMLSLDYCVFIKYVDIPMKLEEIESKL